LDTHLPRRRVTCSYLRHDQQAAQFGVVRQHGPHLVFLIAKLLHLVQAEADALHAVCGFGYSRSRVAVRQ